MDKDTAKAASKKEFKVLSKGNKPRFGIKFKLLGILLPIVILVISNTIFLVYTNDA